MRQLDGLRIRLWGALVSNFEEMLQRLFDAERNADVRTALRGIQWHLDRVLSRPLVMRPSEEDPASGSSELAARLRALLDAGEELGGRDGGEVR